MGRPVFPHELADPDFSWLISTFQENNPHYSCVECGSMPVVFIADPDYEDMQFPEDTVKKDVNDFSEK